MRTKTKLWGLAAGVALAAGLWCSFVVPYEEHYCWIDPTTGSLLRRTYGFFGQKPESVQSTALRQWLEGRERATPFQWQFLDSQDENVWGGTLLFACGRAPPSHVLAQGSIAEWTVKGSTDEQLQELVAVLRTGSPEQQQQATDEACRRGLKLLEERPYLPPRVSSVAAGRAEAQ